MRLANASQKHSQVPGPSLFAKVKSAQAWEGKEKTSPAKAQPSEEANQREATLSASKFPVPHGGRLLRPPFSRAQLAPGGAKRRCTHRSAAPRRSRLTESHKHAPPAPQNDRQSPPPPTSPPVSPTAQTHPRE